MAHEGNGRGAQAAGPEDACLPSSPGLLGKDVAYEGPVLGSFCFCWLITPLGPNDTHVSQTPLSHRGGEKGSICRSYMFFFRHFTETPQPPLAADCKIRKLLPSWGDNSLPQCLSAQPAAAPSQAVLGDDITMQSLNCPSEESCHPP